MTSLRQLLVHVAFWIYFALSISVASDSSSVNYPSRTHYNCSDSIIWDNAGDVNATCADGDIVDCKICCPPKFKDNSPSICGKSRLQNRIAFGNDVPFGKYPWLASIEEERSLINEEYVITAAHCFEGREVPHPYYRIAVRLGTRRAYGLSDCIQYLNDKKCHPEAVLKYVDKIISHEGFNEASNYIENDISLVHLENPIDFEVHQHVRPVCLPGKNIAYNEVYGSFWVSGWGLEETKNKPDFLQDLNVFVLSWSYCERLFSAFGIKFLKNNLCVKALRQGANTCIGDSGGPLMITTDHGATFCLFGLTSFTLDPRCGENRFPVVHTAVMPYLDWIYRIIKNH